MTVTVGTPAPSTSNIQTAVQQFITDYNSAITTIQTQLTQAPSSSDPTQGTLFGDQDLQQLLSNMREQMDATVGGLTGSMSSMLDAGVSTGAASGTSAPSQSAISGDLTLDATTLTQALTSNASAVHSMLQSWSISFSSMVNNEAAPGGTIDTRIQGDDTQSNYLGNPDLQHAGGQHAAAERARPGVRAHGGGAVVQPVDEQLADEPDQRAPDRITTRNELADACTVSKRPRRLKSAVRLPSICIDGRAVPTRPGDPLTMTPPIAAPTPNAYRESAVLSAAPETLVVMLYDGARRFLFQAGVAMRDGQIELSHRKLRRAEDIVRHLLDVLDMEQGELSERLEAIYLFCLRHIQQSPLRPRREQARRGEQPAR